MRAIRVHHAGGPEVMQLEDVELAAARPRRGAAAPSRHRRQFPRHLFPLWPLSSPSLPFTPGSEGAGEVVAVGDGVEGFQARRPGRLCHAARLLRRSAQRRRQAISSSCPRAISLREARGDDAQGPDRAISAAPDLQGRSRATRSSSMPRRAASGRSCANGASISARPSSPPSARRTRPRSPNSAGAKHVIIYARRISRRASPRSPRARNARSSTTASARRPSPPRSTACGPLACSQLRLGLGRHRGVQPRPARPEGLAVRDPPDAVHLPGRSRAAGHDGERIVRGRRLRSGQGRHLRRRRSRRPRACTAISKAARTTGSIVLIPEPALAPLPRAITPRAACAAAAAPYRRGATRRRVPRRCAEALSHDRTETHEVCRRPVPAAKEEGWWETIKVIVQALLIALVVRTVLFQPFNIPSGSLIPTLLIGDYLFVRIFLRLFALFAAELPRPRAQRDARPAVLFAAEARRHRRVPPARRPRRGFHQARHRPARRQGADDQGPALHQRRRGAARGGAAL